MTQLRILSRKISGVNRRIDVVSTSVNAWKRRRYKGTLIILDQFFTIVGIESIDASDYYVVQFASAHDATDGQRLTIFDSPSLTPASRLIKYVDHVTIQIPKLSNDTLTSFDETVYTGVITDSFQLVPSKYPYSIVNGMDDNAKILALDINNETVEILAQSRLMVFVALNKTIFYN